MNPADAAVDAAAKAANKLVNADAVKAADFKAADKLADTAADKAGGGYPARPDLMSVTSVFPTLASRSPRGSLN